MYIIGINGFKRSGKGEVGNAIERNVLVGQVKQVGFADKVKIFGARALGFLSQSDEDCIALMDLAKEYWLIDMVHEFVADSPLPSFGVAQITGRQYLQNVGTEARKLFGGDFWIDQVLPPCDFEDYHDDDVRLSDMHPGVDWLAITDLRFENEAQRVIDLGGEVWRVTRPGTGSDGHASEQSLPNHMVTREIHNVGNLDVLEEAVATCLQLMEEGIR